MRASVTLGKSRGRVERREITTSTRGVAESDWPGLAQFLRIERTTIVDGEERTSITYAITSLTPERASPAKLLDLLRGRWEIENRLFWVRDVVFREDHSRIRTGTAALATSHVRNAAINYLRARKVDNNAAALRENALKVEGLLRELGILKPSPSCRDDRPPGIFRDTSRHRGRTAA